MMERIHAAEKVLECPLLARTRRSAPIRLTVSLTPAPDFLAAMSGIELFPSGVPSGPDVADTLCIRGELTRSGPVREAGREN